MSKASVRLNTQTYSRPRPGNINLENSFSNCLFNPFRSFLVGSSTRQLSLCQSLFRCPSAPARTLLTLALSTTPTIIEQR